MKKKQKVKTGSKRKARKPVSSAVKIARLEAKATFIRTKLAEVEGCLAEAKAAAPPAEVPPVE